MAKRTISICFDEYDTLAFPEGKRFDVHLDGLTAERREEIDAMTPEEQLQKLSPAEFWALRCYQITVGAMAQAGAIKEVKPKR